MSESIFPDWMEGRFVTDAALQRAYERVSAVSRSWLKTCIAQLHALLSQNDASRRLEIRELAQGYESSFVSRPLAWCLILLDESLASGPRTLATLLPPVLAGVEDVYVVRAARSRSPWPPEVLAGIELAGVEQCAQLGQRDLAELLRHIASPEQAEHGPGMVLAPQPVNLLGRNALLHLAEAPHCRVWQSRWSGEIGFFQGKGEALDKAALAWAHPDAVFRCFGSGNDTPLPQGWRQERPDEAAFHAQRFAWSVAPRNMHQDILRYAELVLGSGEEGCWLWPDLKPEMFWRHTAGLVRSVGAVDDMPTD